MEVPKKDKVIVKDIIKVPKKSLIFHVLASYFLALLN